jgi:hypothetical protein
MGAVAAPRGGPWSARPPRARDSLKQQGYRVIGFGNNDVNTDFGSGAGCDLCRTGECLSARRWRAALWRAIGGLGVESQFYSVGAPPLSGTLESRARKNGALKSDPLWRRSGAISPFQRMSIKEVAQASSLGFAWDNNRSDEESQAGSLCHLRKFRAA